jgi:rare lipoprotein A (peptidoglycan hydrolase)
MKYLIASLFILFAFPAQASVKWVDGNPVFYTKKVVKKKVVKKKRYVSKKKRYVKRKIKFSGRVQHGIASYYWKPQRIACSRTRRYNPNLMVAAHKTLKCGTMVRVTNKRNGRSVVVKIDDRGPYIRGRIVDLSVAAATKLGMRKSGVAPVKLEVLK